LPEEATEEEIREMFSEFGETLRFKMIPPYDRSSGKCWIAFDSADKAK